MKIDEITTILFDFDGVLTDNRVWVDSNGNESVSCHRSDGLGFDVLKKLNINVLILSTEENPVVQARANKLKIKAIQGIKNKAEYLKNESSIDLKRTLYVGNDLNDYLPMKLCGFRACPADSHKKIKEISEFVLKKSGGDGVVREIIEELFEIDMIQVLYT